MTNEKDLTVTEKPDEGITKPIFDARMQYYNVLQAHMGTLLKARTTNDLFLMYSTLSGMLDVVAPFISKQNITDADKYLNAASNYLGLKDRFLRLYAEKQLNKASRLIYMASKHMLLPTGAEEITEWDEAEFLKGSDL